MLGVNGLLVDSQQEMGVEEGATRFRLGFVLAGRLQRIYATLPLTGCLFLHFIPIPSDILECIYYLVLLGEIRDELNSDFIASTVIGDGHWHPV